MTTGHSVETQELLTKEPTPCRRMPLLNLCSSEVRGRISAHDLRRQRPVVRQGGRDASLTVYCSTVCYSIA